MTRYYHEQPAELGKALAEKMPPHPSGEDWVVHLVNDGSEAVDLAAQMARVYTGHTELVGLHKACVLTDQSPLPPDGLVIICGLAARGLELPPHT